MAGRSARSLASIAWAPTPAPGVSWLALGGMSAGPRRRRYANIVTPSGRSVPYPDHLRTLATVAIRASVRLHRARREAVGACTGERSMAPRAHRQTRAPTPRPRAG
jgi:GAF domain-containing protein